MEYPLYAHTYVGPIGRTYEHGTLNEALTVIVFVINVKFIGFTVTPPVPLPAAGAGGPRLSNGDRRGR